MIGLGIVSASILADIITPSVGVYEIFKLWEIQVVTVYFL